MKSLFSYFLWSQGVFVTIGYFAVSGIWYAAGALFGLWILCSLYYQISEIISGDFE